MRARILILALAASLVSGCFFSPVGPNTATNAIPTPASGKVSLSYTVPEGAEVTKVTFKVEGQDAVNALSDSTDATHTVELDVSSLTPGLYVADVILNEDTDPTAKLTFVVPDPNAGKTTEGDGSTEASPSPEASSDTSASSSSTDTTSDSSSDTSSDTSSDSSSDSSTDTASGS